MRLALATLSAAAVAATPVQAGDKLILGQRVGASATSYCLRGTMSDGSWTRYGSVAVLPGRHRLSTLIRTDRRIRVPGQRPRRYFRVRDHIGHGSQFDVWSPSCWWSTNVFGRRYVTYRVVLRRIRR